ncbi:hypothetical protein EVAR_74028_1 [Eumeta japonica]|uniref:Uncharacterized protein n=1 Tax=Eumeta variegata TaxID=151549 RepID=A0A4C1SF19_EUMVA|nr:hypothetical protein EVAR_74028_1 [Eumeta japonica]
MSSSDRCEFDLRQYLPLGPNLTVDQIHREFRASSFLPSSFQRPGIPNKWLEADKSYKLTSPHTTMLQPNRHLNHGWQSFSLESPWGYQPPWYRYYNPRWGSKSNPIQPYA